MILISTANITYIFLYSKFYSFFFQTIHLQNLADRLFWIIAILYFHNSFAKKTKKQVPVSFFVLRTEMSTVYSLLSSKPRLDSRLSLPWTLQALQGKRFCFNLQIKENLSP